MGPSAGAAAREIAPPRSGPSPFELDRARKAGIRTPEPQSSGANALAPQAEVPEVPPAEVPPAEMPRAEVPKAAVPPTGIPQAAAPPLAAGDLRERLHAWLHEKGNAHLADAVENASLTITGGDLNVVAPKSYARYFKDRGFEEAVREVLGRPLRVKLSTADAAAGPAAGSVAPISVAAPRKAEGEDEVAGRALANPEVRHFREVFGGEVRKVRNLKE
jgi:hypothetical protein